MTPKLTAVSAAFLALSGVLSPVAAQDYPFRPIEMVVTFGPGGGADLLGRQLARMLEPELGVSIPVSNVAGASGNAGLTRLRTDEPDGYTIGTLIALTVSSWASGLGDSKPEDFEIIAVVQNSPSFLFVPAQSEYKTGAALFDAARAAPGTITVATSGYGTQDDVTLTLLRKAGIDMSNVPLQAPAERYASPLGGHTSAIYEEPGDVAPFLAAGQLLPVVVFDKERHAAFPDVPTSAELGIEISGLDNFRSIAVRAGTDPAITEKLTAALLGVVETDAWKEFCARTYSCTEPKTGAAGMQVVNDFYDTITATLSQ